MIIDLRPDQPAPHFNIEGGLIVHTDGDFFEQILTPADALTLSTSIERTMRIHERDRESALATKCRQKLNELTVRCQELGWM